MTDFLALVRDLRLYLVAVLVSGDWYHRLPYLRDATTRQAHASWTPLPTSTWFASASSGRRRL
jgi:hypothetical protein